MADFCLSLRGFIPFPSKVILKYFSSVNEALKIGSSIIWYIFCLSVFYSDSILASLWSSSSSSSKISSGLIKFELSSGLL